MKSMNIAPMLVQNHQGTVIDFVRTFSLRDVPLNSFFSRQNRIAKRPVCNNNNLQRQIFFSHDQEQENNQT